MDMTIASPKSPPSGVHRLWRLLAIGLSLGIAAHVIVSRRAAVEPVAPAFNVLGPELPPADPRLEMVLDSVDYDRVSLCDVLPDLARRGGLNLIVMWEPLARQGIQKDFPISMHRKHIPLCEALDAALAPPLCWSEEDGIITVTDSVPSTSRLYTRFYGVQHIIQKGTKPPTSMPQGQVSLDRMGDLKRLITEQVLPNSWKDNGGDIGTISDFSNSLIITQTARGHRLVEAFLRKLDQAE
jgi:hypothetical protein